MTPNDRPNARVPPRERHPQESGSFMAFEDYWDHSIVHHRYRHNQVGLNPATDIHDSLTFDTYREHLLGFTPGERVTLEFDYTLRLDECP